VGQGNLEEEQGATGCSGKRRALPGMTIAVEQTIARLVRCSVPVVMTGFGY
jgi:hypothetical protein